MPLIAPDHIIFAPVSKNQWTEDSSIRILLYIVDEPYTYLYNAFFVNNSYIYVINDVWLDKETTQETEYSKFIGMAIDNYLNSKKI